MKLIQNAQAGTFESSDILILIEPMEENTGRIIELQSSVKLQYGTSIKRIIDEVLDRFDVADVRLIATDKGALEATIYARLETAILRSANVQKGTL